MKLVTFEHNAQSRIGALHGDQIVDLHTAFALYLREVEGEAIFDRLADALVPPDMRALFQGGDSSLEAAHKAFDFATHLGRDAIGPHGEKMFFPLSEAKLKAPIIPKKFFHTAGN